MESDQGQRPDQGEVGLPASASLGAPTLTVLERQQVVRRVPEWVQVAAYSHVEWSTQACGLAELGRDEGIVRKDWGIGCYFADAPKSAERRNLRQLGIEEDEIEVTPLKVHQSLVKAVSLRYVESAAASEREHLKDELAIKVVVLDEKDFRGGDHGNRPS
jgi:hypothetical protein